MPRIRGRLYSSCASSTCSLPSARAACWAKMSRISCVRSTRACRARPRGCAAARGRARRRRAGSRRSVSRERSFSSSTLPLPTYVRRAGPGRCCTSARRARPLPSARAPRSRRAHPRRPLPGPELRGRTRARAPGNVGSSGLLCPLRSEVPTSPSGRSSSSTSPRRRAGGVDLRATSRGDVPLATSTTTASRYLREARRQAARAPVRAPDTVPAQGNLPGRIEDGAVPRPRRDGHEGRPRRDDRARPLGGGDGARLRPRACSSSHARSSARPRTRFRACSWRRPSSTRRRS